MKNPSKVKLILTALLITPLFCFTTTTTAPAFAKEDDNSNPVCGNANVPLEIQAASGCPDAKTDLADPSTIVGNVIKAVVGVLGLVAIVVIVYGGVQYMTSTGDSGKTKKARETIIYAAVGLVICALAFAITQFVIDSINNSSSQQIPDASRGNDYNLPVKATNNP